MASLLLNTPVTTSEAPRSGVSPGQVAQPYTELADTLDKTAGALNDIAKPFAEQAGYQAVTRDADGNIQVAKAPIIGDAAVAYERATKIAAAAAGENNAQMDNIALQQKFKDDPQGYLTAAKANRDQRVQNIKDAAGPEVAFTVGRASDQTITSTYSGMVSQTAALNAKRDDATISARVQSAKDDAVALARDGDTSSPAYQHAKDTVTALTNERVNNPALAYPRAQADYELQNFEGEMQANSWLHNIDTVYNDPGVGPDGQAKGGAAAALAAAQRLRTDPNLKLSEAQREQYYHKAASEINANEAQRKQDVVDARASEQELNLSSAAGAKIEPADVDRVANAYKAAGAPGAAARLYASFIRKPLNDDFGKQPLSAQSHDLNVMIGSQAAKTSFDFFTSRGYTPEQASGIVGNLIHESGVNPNASGDGGTSGGIAQFHNERLAALKDFAKQRGTAPTDLNTQLEFIDRELHTTESGTLAKLQGAKTPEDAAKAFIDYERPHGWTPDNPSAGLGFNSRVAAARQTFDASNGTATGASLGVGPATSAWLIANRKRTMDDAAETSWKTIQKDWDEKQIRPANAVVNQVVDAARLGGNAHLLDTISTDMDRINNVQGSGQDALPTQSARIDEMTRLGSQGQLSPGNAAMLKQLTQRRDTITTGLENSPVATTLANFGDRLKTPAPLDLTSDASLATGLQQRAGIVGFAAKNWQVPPRSALDASDVQQVQAALNTQDPAVKGRIFRAISALPDDIRGATLAKIGATGGGNMVSAAAGAMMTQAPDMAQSVFRGQAAINSKLGYTPSDKGESAAYDAKLTEYLPPATFSLAGRTDAQGPLAITGGLIQARYADLSAQAADTTGKFNPDRLKQATEDITGGIVSHNSAPLVAPQRGMNQGTFDRVMQGVTNNDLQNVSTLSGQPVTADYLRNSAQLESIGSGRYLVRLGQDALHPIYAYQGANTESPQKFVLDLRGKNPVDRPPSGVEFRPYPRG